MLDKFYKTEIGDNIKKLRARLNLSQQRFGKKIGISGKTVSAYENGVCHPPLKVLENITNAYDTPLLKVNKEKSSSLRERIINMEQTIEDLKKVLEQSLTF